MENMEIFIPAEILLSSDQEVMKLLMSDSSYWDNVDSFLNPVESVKEYEYIDEYVSDYDYWDYYYYIMIQEDNQILEDEINTHFSKRNNRKFIRNNNFKNKVRDKRILFKKGVRFILNAAYDRRGRKNTFDSNIVSMDLVETTQVQGYQEVLLYRQPFLYSFNPFNRYNQSRSTRVVFEAYRPLNIYSAREKLVLVDYYDRDTVYSIDSKYTVVQQYPHLNFYEKSYTEAELPKEQQVSTFSFYYNGKTSFFGKNVIDSRFCHNQYLYEREGGSWYYNDRLKIKDRLDRFQCIKDIKEGVTIYEDKGILDDMEYAAEYFVADQYFDEYEKYSYVIDAHIEPEQWWNEKHISIYNEYPNIHFEEGYDIDYYHYEDEDYKDQEDPYDYDFEEDDFYY